MMTALGRISKAARHRIDYSRWAEVFQAPLIGLLVYWYQFPPPPGYAIAWLAAAGVIMAVRAEHFTITEKVVWILTAGAFLLFEIHAISKDRDNHDQEQAAIRWRDDFNQKQERRQFSALLKQGEGLFRNERKPSTRTINQFTGGSSYAVVVALLALPVKEPNTFALAVFIGSKREHNNLSDARIYMEKEGAVNGGTRSGAIELLAGGHGPVWTGDIFATSGATFPTRQVSITPSTTGITTYIINVYARNKPTVKTLRIRLNVQTKEWEQSYKIIRVLKYGGPGKKNAVETLEETKPEWQRSLFIEGK